MLIPFTFAIGIFPLLSAHLCYVVIPLICCGIILPIAVECRKNCDADTKGHNALPKGGGTWHKKANVEAGEPQVVLLAVSGLWAGYSP
jgi:hypothetical protein